MYLVIEVLISPRSLEGIILKYMYILTPHEEAIYLEVVSVQYNEALLCNLKNKIMPKSLYGSGCISWCFYSNTIKNFM